MDQQCYTCQNVSDYNEKHDAYLCKTCDIWLEKNCYEAHCTYCDGRPEYPSQVEEDV